MTINIDNHLFQAHSQAKINMKSYSLTLMLTLVLCAVVVFAREAQAADNSGIEEANLTIYVHGALTQSVCRLEMSSANQTVELGEVGTGRLHSVGAQGKPVRLELRLEDCLSNEVASQDLRHDSLVWARNELSVSVSFSGVRDADNPELIKVQGAEGVGLRIKDVQGRDVRVGSRGIPLMIIPGQNALSFTIIPERTKAPLTPGSYLAQVNFKMSYD